MHPSLRLETMALWHSMAALCAKGMFAATRQLCALHVSLCHLGLQNSKCQPSVVLVHLVGMLKTDCSVDTIPALQVPNSS